MGHVSKHIGLIVRNGGSPLGAEFAARPDRSLDTAVTISTPRGCSGRRRTTFRDAADENQSAGAAPLIDALLDAHPWLDELSTKP